jgi:ATP-dependent 26S proteasome regulatory subunit
MTAEFSQKLHNHVLSGGGVTAVRTRDPVASINAAIAFQTARELPLCIWDAARGWLKTTDPIMAMGDGAPNLASAFKGILSEEQNDTYPYEGLFVFTMVHPFINAERPNPEMFQLLSMMAHALPRVKTERRVLLCVPPSFTMPAELRELIPVIDHAAPELDELATTIENVLTDMKPVAPKYVPNPNEDDLMLLAQAAAGMIGPELENAFSRVVFSGVTERKLYSTEELRSRLLTEKAEMVKRSRALEVMPSIPLDQVGGLQPLKDWVQTRVNAMDPAAWELGVDKPKGCALAGPPGTGKSLLGKVIGGVLGVATIRFDISAVFSGLVGSSEQNMREALFMLESLAPCVVLLDEIDKVVGGSQGTSGDSGVSQKVLGSLLTFMQENDKPIFWVPTLNRAENIPAELLRAGRLDEVFGVARPTQQERVEILTIHLSKRQVDVASIADDIEHVATQTEGFVGAEIEGIASAARLNAYNEGPDVEVTLEHLMTAVKGTKPLAQKMPEQFTAMEAWCDAHAVPANAKAEAKKTASPRTRRAISAPTGSRRKARMN